MWVVVVFGTITSNHDSGNGAKRSESEEGEDVKDREATSFSWQAVNRTKQREQRDRPNHV